MRILVLLNLYLLTACTGNILDEIADKDTNASKYFQAKMEINSRNYTEAINLLESLDPAFIASRERIPIHASAYAGRCGLEFLTLLETMQSASSSTILGLLMGSFPGALAANVQDCIDAENILQTIGDESERNGDENLLIAFNALAKIGTILSSLADTDDDSVADAGFDQCDAGDLTDELTRELGASIGVVMTSLTAIGTSYIDDSLADVNALCALNPPQTTALCNTTEPENFTAEQVRFIRYAIGSNDAGIDSCGGNNLADCAAIYEPGGLPDCP